MKDTKAAAAIAKVDAIAAAIGAEIVKRPDNESAYCFYVWMRKDGATFGLYFDNHRNKFEVSPCYPVRACDNYTMRPEHAFTREEFQSFALPGPVAVSAEREPAAIGRDILRRFWTADYARVWAMLDEKARDHSQDIANNFTLQNNTAIACGIELENCNVQVSRNDRHNIQTCVRMYSHDCPMSGELTRFDARVNTCSVNLSDVPTDLAIALVRAMRQRRAGK